MGWAVTLAVAEAAAYANGVVVQQRAATAPVRGSGVGPNMLRVLTRPLWVLGVGLDAAGFALEFLTLRAGALTLVQPLLVSGLLFALPLGAVLTGLRVAGRDLAAAALVVVGLTTAVAVAAPDAGLRTAGPSTWFVTVAVVVAVVSGLGLLAVVHHGPVLRAVDLAAAAAEVNGLLAAFGKAAAVRIERGWIAALLSWPSLGLAATAVLTLTLAAAAFRTGAPTAAIGVLFAGEPLAGVILGAVLFGDTVHHGPLTTTVLVTSLLVCAVGVSLLARSPVVVASYRPPPPDPMRSPHTPAVGVGQQPPTGPPRRPGHPPHADHGAHLRHDGHPRCELTATCLTPCSFYSTAARPGGQDDPTRGRSR